VTVDQSSWQASGWCGTVVKDGLLERNSCEIVGGPMNERGPPGGPVTTSPNIDQLRRVADVVKEFA
jgi:hypothetical protein